MYQDFLLQSSHELNFDSALVENHSMAALNLRMNPDTSDLIAAEEASPVASAGIVAIVSARHRRRVSVEGTPSMHRCQNYYQEYVASSAHAAAVPPLAAGAAEVSSVPKCVALLMMQIHLQHRSDRPASAAADENSPEPPRECTAYLFDND